MAALSDDVMSDGDVAGALQRIARWGMHSDGASVPGIQDLLQQVRSQRQRELERYHLDSMMEDIERRLDESLEVERGAIDRKVEEAREAEGDDEWRRALETIAERKREQLVALPTEVGATIAT